MLYLYIQWTRAREPKWELLLYSWCLQFFFFSSSGFRTIIILLIGVNAFLIHMSLVSLSSRFLLMDWSFYCYILRTEIFKSLLLHLFFDELPLSDLLSFKLFVLVNSLDYDRGKSWFEKRNFDGLNYPV